VLSGIFLSAGLDKGFLKSASDLPVGLFSAVVCAAAKLLCRLAMLHLQFFSGEGLLHKHLKVHHVAGHGGFPGSVDLRNPALPGNFR
jgi:hypothetical protein